MVYGVTRYANVAYGTITDTSTNCNQVMDIYVPINASGVRPCIVFIHGGGWNSGGKGTYNGLGPYYASLGYVCASLNYRWTVNNATYQLPWPTQIVDCQAAVRWLRANAATYNIDTNKFLSYGDSAGSHLALCLAIYSGIHAAYGTDTNTAVSTNTGYSSQVQAVVDQFGPTDIAKIYTESNTTGYTAALDLMNQTTPTTNASGYSEASPNNNITGIIGPVFITQGNNDTTVPQDQSQELFTTLQSYKSPVTYRAYIGDHEYSGVSAAQVDTIKREIQTFIQSVFPVS